MIAEFHNHAVHGVHGGDKPVRGWRVDRATNENPSEEPPDFLISR
jgi:hypothetical protein